MEDVELSAIPIIRKKKKNLLVIYVATQFESLITELNKKDKKRKELYKKNRLLL